MSAHLPELDLAVARALEGYAAFDGPRPALLLWPATGAGLLPERLDDAREIELRHWIGLPPLFAEERLWLGRWRGLDAWIAPELSAEAAAEGLPLWHGAFFAWLAARSGARLFLLSSAGASLSDSADGPRAGELALVSDHLNLSGSSPLSGLGNSRLGPLFPDLSQLHDPHLRREALAQCSRLGIAAREAVLACTLGPSLDTPAERRFQLRAGAQVAAQASAAPLLAAAHAGMTGLCALAITEASDRARSLEELLRHSERLAPALEELWLALAPQLASRARAASAEEPE